MKVLNDFFRNAELSLKIYDAFLADKFSRACVYHRIVFVSHKLR